jgi:hypothetical protein
MHLLAKKGYTLHLRMSGRQITLLALLYVLMSCYALYMNTHHVLSGMKTFCPICVAAKNLSRTTLNSHSHEIPISRPDVFFFSVEKPFTSFIETPYHSRDPPHIS